MYKSINLGITKGLREYEEFLKSPMAGASEIDYGEIKEITQKSKNKQGPSPFMDEPKELYKQSSFKSVPGGDSIKPSGQLNLQKAISCGGESQKPS